MKLKASECPIKGRHVRCPKCGAVVPDWCRETEEPRVESPATVEAPTASVKKARKAS